MPNFTLLVRIKVIEENQTGSDQAPLGLICSFYFFLFFYVIVSSVIIHFELSINGSRNTYLLRAEPSNSIRELALANP